MLLCACPYAHSAPSWRRCARPPASLLHDAPLSTVPPARAPCVRRGRWADIQPVAQLCAAAFLELPGAVPVAPGSVEGLQEFMESKYGESMAREVVKAMSVALQRKEDAAVSSRRARAARRATALRAAQSGLALRGESVDSAALAEAAKALEATWPAGPPAEEARLRRARQWTCLVTHSAEGQLTGWYVFLIHLSKKAATPNTHPRTPPHSAVLAWCVPDAALPPPFPSSKPQRLYISNMAVSPLHRRRGVATALLRAGERLARAWGESEVWLHVDEVNDGGRALYESQGFDVREEDPWWIPAAKRKLLLAKRVA